MPYLENHRHELFCKAYVLDPVGSKAAISAGYSPKTSDETQRRILARPDVKARIAELRAEIDTEFKIEASDVLKRLYTIATADARDLTQYRVGACRFCHGIGHLFQWKTEREYLSALSAARKGLAKGDIDPDPELDPNWPDLAGGIGFKLTCQPNPDCPECAGLGHPYVTATDSGKLTAEQAMLFAGAKHGANGIEIAMQDRAKPLEMVAKHLGLAKEQVLHDTTDRLTAGLVDILGRLDAAAPIRRGITP